MGASFLSVCVCTSSTNRISPQVACTEEQDCKSDLCTGSTRTTPALSSSLSEEGVAVPVLFCGCSPAELHPTTMMSSHGEALPSSLAFLLFSFHCSTLTISASQHATNLRKKWRKRGERESLVETLGMGRYIMKNTQSHNVLHKGEWERQTLQSGDLWYQRHN